MKTSFSAYQRITIENLSFRPAPGSASPHIQTIIPALFSKGGEEPPSAPFFIRLTDGDSLYCKMSTPFAWHPLQKTILMLHGMLGSDSAAYMIRMSRKFYQAGYRVLRLNLRGSGQGIHFARRPYHAGASHDVLQAIQTLKTQAPKSPLVLIGFSLGGNIVLKLLGELSEKASVLIESAISVCAPVDLKQTVELLLRRSNHFYHRYYVKGLKRQGSIWIGKHSIKSIIDYDNIVTAPQWGYRDAFDYYQKCSSKDFLPDIHQNCHLIFTVDDPFVNYQPAIQHPLSPTIKIWLSRYGGHMGFLGWAGKEHGYNWLDALLLKLVSDL